MNERCRTCSDTRELLELERARASLAETRGAAKDRLLDLAASESSALANALLGWTQALRRDFTSRAARDHAMDLMEARIESHLALLQRLLDASGTSAGKELALVRLELRDVVESAIAGERALALERSVQLAAAPPPLEGAVVLADRDRVVRSLGDLLGECIRSAEVGSIVNVEITTDALVAAVRLTVTHRRTAFDDQRVGVVAARHAAAFHGGSLETRADGFVLQLPAFEAASAAARTSPQKTLLVIRHEPEIAEVLAALATARGFEVLTVHDEELATRAFEVHDPDVVVVGSPHALDRLRELAGDGDRIRTITSAAEASALLDSLAAERRR